MMLTVYSTNYKTENARVKQLYRLIYFEQLSSVREQYIGAMVAGK